ncbi:MAG TPA: cysteine dioxygenase family protein [Candidatus Sulfopaludibacter sp.]|jgi:cysteine dioxygenase|nr:cysteine dioxygenase family protein [Candidatus Sulfopaludibacter sp.]
MVTIDRFAAGLAAIPRESFTHEGVLNYLRDNPVDPATLDPYTFFCEGKYTRNLILRTPLFELIAICWESGQVSSVHNHRGQNCWMAIAYGKVQVQNFRLVRHDPDALTCELEPTTRFLIDAATPGEVDPEEPIHLVANLASFGSRAVTLHVYSLPFDTCEVYDLKNNRYADVQLSNASEFGVAMDGFTLEKVALR